MRIVIAPDSFKDSMTAQEAAEQIAAGVQEVWPGAECVRVPMADGGEGTVRSLVDATGGRLISQRVTDPLGRSITATFGVLGDGRTAIIEMAAASGLPLLSPRERDPLRASTFGTGELLRAAREQDVSRIIVGIGGSATNDGGAGMLQALGGRLLDADGQDLPRGGAALAELSRIDLSGVPACLDDVEIVVASDVENPLTGPSGASRIFGPQKGATPEQVEQLEKALTRYAAVIRQDLGRDVEHEPGAGAAGGLGAGLMAFLGARFERGIDLVIEHTRLDHAIAGADLVITGEGSIDEQTRFGKTPYGVAQAAGRHGVPVIALAGRVTANAAVLHDHGIDTIMPIVPSACSLEDALREGPTNLRTAAATAARLLRLGGRVGDTPPDASTSPSERTAPSP